MFSAMQDAPKGYRTFFSYAMAAPITMLLYGLLSFVGGMIVLLYQLYKAAILALVLLVFVGVMFVITYISWFAYLSHHVCGGPRQAHYIAQSFAVRQYYSAKLIEDIPWEQEAMRQDRGVDLLEPHGFGPQRPAIFSAQSALAGTELKEHPPAGNINCLRSFSRAERTLGMKLCEVTITSVCNRMMSITSRSNNVFAEVT